jgi:putative FmdB family regulatory protein
MPFYEYECSACKFYVESLQKISDPPLIKCPSCGKDTMQRLISAPVFRLKGAGWYETDFKSDAENKRNLADDKEPTAAASSDSDDKKIKVRASKALKKVATKKAAKKSPAKSAGKASKTQAAVKPAKKSAKKSAKPAAKKAPGKKKVVAKKTVKKPARKSAKKAAKKPVAKSAARKK